MKIGAVVVKTLLLAVVGTPTLASPREITKYLMNQPVSRPTFGISELNNILEQSRATIGMTYIAASYNFESDSIKIHGFCGNCARDITEASCGEVIDKVRSVGLLINGEAPGGSSLGRISGRDNPDARFEGYMNAAETEKKILRNVFEEGDAWYRTGDLMRIDECGFIYFVDRIGDTFRWNGENVSTSEVEQALSFCPGVLDIAGLRGDCPIRERTCWNGCNRRG